MEQKVVISFSPENLGNEWDQIADFYFQSREFLSHLQKYNPCSQRYYELFSGDKLIAGTVLYTLKINLFTFLNIPSPLKMQVIGIPASVATPPLIGDPACFRYLFEEILKKEKGFILGLNMRDDYLRDKVLNMRTLPTIILKEKFSSIESYENALRYNYRRRIHNIRKKFRNVTVVSGSCSIFTGEHYRLYLEIMKRTRTKLETLSEDLFRNLPPKFILTTYYSGEKMLSWHITCVDGNGLFFFFGGLDYSLRDDFQSYNNNLLGIISEAITRQSDFIDFGQTAESAKCRLGAKPEERRMFFYHRNPLIFYIIRPFKNLLTYSNMAEVHNVFKMAV